MGKVVVDGVGKEFGGDPILRNVTFSLESGEFVGLVGPSGGGKSVLLKVLGKVLEPSWGSIRHEASDGDVEKLAGMQKSGENLSAPSASVNCTARSSGDGSKDSDDHSHSIGFLFQEGALFDSLSVLDNVAFPLLSGSRTKRCQREEAYRRSLEILREVGLSKAAQKLPGQLSGGMRRRVGIARALVHNPNLVLLDDPTGGLDPVAARVIIDLILELHAHYQPTVVLVSHDIRRLLPSVNRVLALFDGAITCDMQPTELRRTAPPEVVSFLATRFDFDAYERGEAV